MASVHERAGTLPQPSYLIDVDAIRDAGLRLGVDPLGGASLPYWQAIKERHGLDLTIVNDELDPTFRFVPLDWDGKIRMDCSGPYTMARLPEMAGDFDVAGLAERFGHAAYRRIDVAASAREKDVLEELSPEQVTSDELAGEPITAVLTEAPGNGAPIGGLKIAAEHGWFAARPSGTEDVYKVYAESLDGEERLERILEEAREIVKEALS